MSYDITSQVTLHNLLHQRSKDCKVLPHLLCQGREAMSPILTAGQAVVAASKSLLANTKDLAMNPSDPELWQRYSAHAKALNEAMRSLLGAIK